MLSQGSAGAQGLSSLQKFNGDAVRGAYKAMRPSRGGRLMITPWAWSRSQLS